MTKKDIEHDFIHKAHNLKNLFEVNSLSGFMRELDRQSVYDVVRYPENDYKGDGFEFLIELFLKTSWTDNRIGIKDYHPIKKNDDKGADGTGINLRKEVSLIQVKFRMDTNSVLVHNEDNLGNLLTYGFHMSPYVVPIENKGDVPRHYIFTTAKGLHHHTDNEMFKNRVKCFGYKELTKLMNNIHFWDFCRDILK